MGKPSKIEPAKVSESYNWGDFGSAGSNGVNLSSLASSNVQTTQKGIGQYLNELINPSYDNASFKARQELLDQSNDIYAQRLGAQAMARGARGNATQAILNSIAANRGNNMRNAMTQEDARVRNILSALSGIEGNYWQQSNAMANNILTRATQNASAQNAANIANTNNYNAWKNNLLSTGVGAAMTLLAGPVAGALAGGVLGSGAITDVNGNVIGQAGGYGTYDPDFIEY